METFRKTFGWIFLRCSIVFLCYFDWLAISLHKKNVPEFYIFLRTRGREVNFDFDDDWLKMNVDKRSKFENRAYQNFNGKIEMTVSSFSSVGF